LEAAKLGSVAPDQRTFAESVAGAVPGPREVRFPFDSADPLAVLAAFAACAEASAAAPGVAPASRPDVPSAMPLYAVAPGGAAPGRPAAPGPFAAAPMPPHGQPAASAPAASGAARPGLDAIPGIGPVAAQMILAEIGLDMSRFPTPAHLTSWARFAPGVSESAGRKEGKAGTGKGNRYLGRVLGDAAVSAARTDTFLGERYRRIARRRGKERAIVAVGRSILVIIWALLSDHEAQFIDLGPDYYASRNNPERKVRQHVRELQELRYSVTLNPAA
jgi:hypothetical protein